MKIYLFLITVIGLLLLAGCKASVKAPSDTTNVSSVAQEQITNNSLANESNSSQVSEEPKETIKDAYTSVLTENGTVNESMADKTIDAEAYEVPEGTYIVEARKTLNGFTFFPLELTIKAGETVRFINAMNYMEKKATAIFYPYQTGLFRSPELNYGEYYEHTFTEPGNFTYNAIPYQSWFKKGMIIVTE